MASQYTEELLTKFFLQMDDDTLRSITNSYELKHRVDESTVDEIKDEIWRYLWSRVHWGAIFRAVQDSLPLESESESENEKTE